jgi:hypothetical protein
VQAGEGIKKALSALISPASDKQLKHFYNNPTLAQFNLTSTDLSIPPIYHHITNDGLLRT